MKLFSSSVKTQALKRQCDIQLCSTQSVSCVQKKCFDNISESVTVMQQALTA